MQTISAILIGLSWLAIALLLLGAGLAVYAWVRARRESDPWGWREIGEELEQKEQKKG